MHKASIALAAGADFELLGPDATMLRGTKPVVAVCVRTGSGKSQTSRGSARSLLAPGSRWPSCGIDAGGDHERMRVQRFATLADIDDSDPTVEGARSTSPVELGMVMYAGVDYAEISSRPRTRPT